ncbi:hypothetical protein CRUP_032113 [Coryphaenoides rupestris]|nr:hypothetical protein CRUP_032113 [Coryphaenoides rupestris]
MSAGPSGVCLRCFMCSVPMCGPNMWYQKDTQRSSSGELTVGLTSRATSVSWWPVASPFQTMVRGVSAIREEDKASRPREPLMSLVDWAKSEETNKR